MPGEIHPNTVARVRTHLERRGRVCLRVHGTSMLPWVRPRDIVLVRRASPDAARCGDLVLFAQNGQLFLHRVIKKKERVGSLLVLVKGDAHPHPDAAVEPEELLGRVVRMYRGRRRVDLDAPAQLLLGILIARVSACSHRWYPAARLAARVILPFRRALSAFFAASAL
ncbi:MAG: S24/S26 family peptidase [Burkholderiales bacterium]